MTAVPSKDKATYWLAVAAGVAGGMVLCMLMAFAAYLYGNSTSISNIIPQVAPQLGPELTPTPAGVRLLGKGNAVIDVSDYSYIGNARYTHDGKGMFVVVPYAADGQRLNARVSEVGPCFGRFIWNQYSDTLHITADGNWTFELFR